MGVDLASAHGGNAGMNWYAWTYIMKLGFCHGWRPCGSRCPDDYPDDYHDEVDWDGNYTSNNGQRVTAEDADALAAALERALACDHEACGHDDTRDAATRDPAGREWLGGLIAFFRKGEFAIY